MDATLTYTLIHTQTYLFSLVISNQLSACNKDDNLMHYWRFFLKQPQLNLFANIQDICQILPKYIQKLLLWKNLAIKKSYKNTFPVPKYFKNSIRCIRFDYVNNRFRLGNCICKLWGSATTKCKHNPYYQKTAECTYRSTVT